MHSSFGKLGLLALVVGTLAGSTGGCATERDPIDRVQANAIPKSFFVGQKLNDASDDPEFYARTMVINVPYGESAGDLLFTNTINSVAKIKWEIEEKNLIGRVSFERIEGTDGQGLTPVKDPKRDPSRPLAQNAGLVVYNFKIDSQFDIRRSYNQQTGEESNTVEENTTDRVWADREYIRVDWSQNLVTNAYDFDTMSLLGVYDGIKYTPMSFSVNNPDDENAPAYDIKNGYLDVTNKVFAEPQMIEFGDGFKFPGCLLPNYVMGGNNPVGNCNPNEITLRHSFKRVTKTDYEPMDWDGHHFETYGAFTMERQGYARDYGLTDEQWKRYISRYNIWERSHYYADAQNMTGPVSCTDDIPCGDPKIAAFAGASHCDTYSHMCTLPYEQRKAKPVVWYYSDGSDPDYYEATRDAAEEWDTAMRVAVQTAKHTECMRFGDETSRPECANKYPGVITGNFAEEEDAIFLVHEINACRRQAMKDKKKDPIAECNGLAEQLGGDRGYAPAVTAIAEQPAMVILCHSPVGDEDPEVCGKKGTVARLGDLRYHLVTSVASPQYDSPWGIMSDSNDPVTGEHISASINVWTYVDDLWARGLVDTFRYIGGELSTDQITNGTYVHDWVKAAQASNGLGLSPVMTKDEVDKRIAGIMGTTVTDLRRVRAKLQAQQNFTAGRNVLASNDLQKALLGNVQKVRATQAVWDAPTTSQAEYDAHFTALKGTTAEAAVMTPAMQQLAGSAMGDFGASATASTSDALAGSASILQGLKPGLRSKLENTLENSLAKRGACMARMESLAPLGYTALANELQAKFGKFNSKDPPNVQTDRADKMKGFLRRRGHAAVITHEMGHSFGERHNFVSSSDPWNFRPQYWALRTNGKKVTTDCPDDGSANGKTCIGPRWTDPVTDNEQKNMIHTWAQSSTMEYPGEPSQDLLGLGAYDFGAARMFYGDVAEVYADARFKATAQPGLAAIRHQADFGGLLGMQYGSDVNNPIHYSQLDKQYSLIEECHTVDPQRFKPSNWDETKDGVWSPLLDGHIVTTEDGKPTKCSQPKVDFVRWADMVDNATADKTKAQDAGGRARVPHGFASDDWADLGNISVFRHDNGADLYEQMHFWQAQQEMTHIFSNYRRGRRDFGIWGAFQRTLTRYEEKMRDSSKAIGLYVNVARDTVVNYNAQGEDPAAFAATVIAQVAPAQVLASSIAFDHFAHVFSRPQPGPHGTLGAEDFGTGATVARSFDIGGFVQKGVQLLQVANGVTGGYGTISLGGRPLENALPNDSLGDPNNVGRDYNRDYTLNVGSYYEKAFTAYLYTESRDNFISASRDDFLDPRFRAVSLADVFPDGYRRWLANNLTNDEQIKGVYVAGDGGGTDGAPALDADGFATLGTTSWWPKAGPEVCLPQGDRIYCSDPAAPGSPTPAGGTVADPQVGFEQQKFALLLSLIYIRENQRTNWTDMMHVYDLSNGDPGFENRIEFHDPTGKVWMAQTFGTEVIFGKTVQKGIAARVLEFANELLAQSVVTEPVMLGAKQVGLKAKLDADGNVQYLAGADPAPNCEASRFCQKMKDYSQIPKLMHDWGGFFAWGGDSGLRGIY